MNFAKPLRNQAYDYLKKRILDGSLQPGEIHSETKIAKECGISRTPMRDALQSLATDRYIDIIPSKGFRIHELTTQDLIDTYQIRCAIEGYCIVHLTMNKDTDSGRLVLKELEHLINMQDEVIKSSHTPEDFTIYDTRFHEQIVHYLNNQVITSTFENYLFQIKEQTLISLRKDGRLEETLKEHQAILDGIQSGDISKAYKAILFHVGQNKNIINI